MVPLSSQRNGPASWRCKVDPSSWEEHANTHISPAIGLPELPFVRFTGYVPQPGDPRVPLMEMFSARKWAPLLRYAAGRPFAWIDDVIPPRLVRGSLWRRDRVLLPIDPGEGLERRHVDRLLSRPPRPGATSPVKRRAAG
ncbi:hypothetical protein [Streptomyces sp. XY431]|uniref:hypothetical protein n=1 Tax=Streptomyces sp. XY431 TaxID=1415562 RepID=UPI000AD1E531|nr:hypothetical protein [Streptomyces sp. XY431]